jgi:hypothetical protein
VRRFFGGGGDLETIRDVTPTTIIMVSVLFCFTAVGAAVVDGMLGVGDGHFWRFLGLMMKMKMEIWNSYKGGGSG